MGSYKRSKSAVKQTTQIQVYCYEIARLLRKLAMRGGDHLQPFGKLHRGYARYFQPGTPPYGRRMTDKKLGTPYGRRMTEALGAGGI
jgi:hypothetical protein